jgi:signal transduction histidine kinase
VIRSIRLRIALFVLGAVALTQVILSLLVLQRLASAQRNEVDALLQEELSEIEGLLGGPGMRELIEAKDRHTSKWSETFYEVRSAAGELVVASANVPAQGLGPAVLPVEVEQRVAFWERVHPQSRRGHRRIRVAEKGLDGYRVRVARSLRASEKTYLTVRARLAGGLLGVTALGAIGAWWMARRALRPLRSMIAQAQELGVSLEGELTRTRSGDELDRLAAVLNDLLGRLRVEVQRMRRMTADAAHALRTPLTAIRGSLEVMQRGADPVVAAALGPTLEAIDELGQLTNRLLLLERLESQGAPADGGERIALDGLVADLVDTLQVVAADRGIELRCNAAPVRVRGDVQQLRNAVANLIDNALRHTPRNGRVEVCTASVSGRARVIVSDTGPGLRPEQLERVFERFYSEPGPGGGTGLGLPIARAIARAHGGELTASSPGGARFELDLPLA